MVEREIQARKKQPGGRRKGGSSTREDILRSAVEVFAERGYEKATLRAITTKAGVDVALVSHFFGGKQGLFDEAVLLHGERTLKALMDTTSEERPVPRLLRAYFSMWEDPDTALVVRALFRSGLESEENLERLKAIVMSRVADELRASTDRDTPHVRFGDAGTGEIELVSQVLVAELLGIGISRYMVRLPPLADLPLDELVERLTPQMEVLTREAMETR